MCSIGSSSTTAVGAGSAGAIGGGASIGGGTAGFGSTLLGARRVAGGAPRTLLGSDPSPAPTTPGSPRDPRGPYYLPEN